MSVFEFIGGSIAVGFVAFMFFCAFVMGPIDVIRDGREARRNAAERARRQAEVERQKRVANHEEAPGALSEDAQRLSDETDAMYRSMRAAQ